MPDYELVEGARFVDDESEFVSAAVKGLYKCWLENRDKDGLIDVRCFELEKYPDILPEAIILDVVNEGEDLRIRFLGSEMVNRYPDATGRLVREAVPPGLYLERTLKIFRAVFATGRAIVNGPARTTLSGLQHLTLEGLYVPMTLAGGKVDRVLAVNAFWIERPEI